MCVSFLSLLLYLARRSIAARSSLARRIGLKCRKWVFESYLRSLKIGPNQQKTGVESYALSKSRTKMPKIEV